MTTQATQTETTLAPVVPWDEMEMVDPGCTTGIDRGAAKGRAATLRTAMERGATLADLCRIARAARASTGRRVSVPTRYGGLSRGRCWGRQGSGSDVTWADKDGDTGTVYLTEGRWVVGSDDGYRRKEDPVTWRVSRVGGVLIAQ